MVYDTIIRNGLIVDGSGKAPFVGSVGITGDMITSVGHVDGTGKEEIDAAGCLVTPGFVDIHTHYDGQALWSNTMAPSSSHGVTTVVMGNCGVGFAPCRPHDHELLINTMEGVEDIPGVVMAAGLDWSWETFPEFMDKLERHPRDIDVAMLLPHSALRIYAMGERGADRSPATPDDLVRMGHLVKEAMDVGALGLGTSRIFLNRRRDGEHIASYEASEDEMTAIARAMGEGTGRVFQIVPELAHEKFTLDDQAMAEQIRMLGRVSAASKLPVTFTLAQTHSVPDQWRMILDVVTEMNEKPDVELRPQIFPRPFGMIAGFDLSANPFSLCPSYIAVADLPLAERIIELRKSDVRERIINEEPIDPVNPLVALARAFDYTYVLSDPLNYEPDPTTSIGARAKRLGVTAKALAYDLLLEDGGHAMLYVALANFGQGSLDFVLEMLDHPDTVVGLGDGGAHYGMICDSSYPTFMLAHWARDRSRARLSVERIVQCLTSEPAQMMRLKDRGVLAVNFKADLNIIDFPALQLSLPTVCYDLPSGGRRLDQQARGYRRTIVSGKTILLNDRLTGALPGKLVRRRADGCGGQVGLQ
jgi:N-acyl-D-amino-acid deacylase